MPLWKGLIMQKYILYLLYRPFSLFPQCIRQISHNAPFCNRNVHACAHFCYKMVHCGIWNWCIVGFVQEVCLLGMQRSPISSLWLQLTSTPHPLWVHQDKSLAVEEHWNMSTQIRPEPRPSLEFVDSAAAWLKRRYEELTVMIHGAVYGIWLQSGLMDLIEDK